MIPIWLRYEPGEARKIWIREMDELALKANQKLRSPLLNNRLLVAGWDTLVLDLYNSEEVEYIVARIHPRFWGNLHIKTLFGQREAYSELYHDIEWGRWAWRER